MTDPVFSIRGYEEDFDTGRTGDGRQVVLGLLCPSLVAYFFTPDGGLIGREVRPWEYPAPGAEGIGYAIYDKRFQGHLAEQMQGWKQELGFSPGPIRVGAFFDEEYYVGFEQSDEQGLGASDEIVFYWAKEYFLAPDGEGEST